MKAVKCACGTRKNPKIENCVIRCPHCWSAVAVFYSWRQRDQIIAWNAAQRALKAAKKQSKKGAKKNGSK